MSERDFEMFIPFGMLAVGDDASTGDRSAPETDGDVGIACDDFAVTVVVVVVP